MFSAMFSALFAADYMGLYAHHDTQSACSQRGWPPHHTAHSSDADSTPHTPDESARHVGSRRSAHAQYIALRRVHDLCNGAW